MRCKEHNKVIFTAEITAQLACVKAALEGDPSLSWYFEKECGHWHLTNTVKRGKTGTRVKWVERFNGGQDGTAPAAA